MEIMPYFFQTEGFLYDPTEFFSPVRTCDSLLRNSFPQTKKMSSLLIFETMNFCRKGTGS
jgi:hypothetical protein